MGTEEPLPARHRIGRALGRGAANAVLMALACCSLTACTASYVANEAISSNDAVETATNDNIVSNILRARDGVPTFYSAAWSRRVSPCNPTRRSMSRR